MEQTAKTAFANTFLMYFKAHSYHWNIEGSDFPQMHEFFGDLYDEIYGSVDKFAEEIRLPGDRKEYFKYSDNALENLLKMKLTQYDPFRNILAEGVIKLKNRSLSENKINDLLSYMKLEESYITALLEEWKKFQKNAKSKEPLP